MPCPVPGDPRRRVQFRRQPFEHGINFNEVPLWQRRGVGLYWEDYEKIGFDPVKQVEVQASRRRVKVDRELPMKDEYSEFLRRFLS